MYNFIDVTEIAESTLPAEALQINGQYIESLIEGYRTLHVSGREALSPEIETIETGVSDGSAIKSKRFPARIITVTYQLIAKTNEAFRAAYNKLGGVLNVENATLIFADEPDKYFTGSFHAIGEVEAGRNAVIGTIEFLCADPFKYSVTEYVTTAGNVTMKDESGKSYTAKGFQVNYKGTYKSFPTFEAEFKGTSENGETEATLNDDGECGYVAFFDADENILQFGNPTELDGNVYEKSQTMMNQTFQTSTAWGTTAKKLWTVNKAKSPLPNSEAQVGAVGMGDPYANAPDSMQFMTCLNYGESTAERYGASITRQIGADAAGDTGAANFTLTYRHKFCAAPNAKKQCGIFYALLVGGGKIIAGVRVSKYSIGNYKGKVDFYVYDKHRGKVDVDLYFENVFLGNNGSQACTISKMGNTVSFDIGGIKRNFSCYDTGFAEAKATEVSYVFARYKSAEPVTYNGIFSSKLVKHNCDTFTDIPNKFSANDVLTANCRNGAVLLNGLERPDFGAFGNDWENLYLVNGTNFIGASYSDWLTDEHAPTLKMKYREVFL